MPITLIGTSLKRCSTEVVPALVPARFQIVYQIRPSGRLFLSVFFVGRGTLSGTLSLSDCFDFGGTEGLTPRPTRGIAPPSFYRVYARFAFTISYLA